jgi:hypothetical protein
MTPLCSEQHLDVVAELWEHLLITSWPTNWQND